MRQYTILIVDDEPDNLRTIVNYLKESNKAYNILVAPNGMVALKVAEKKLPDMIITDWEMPVMDGITLIELLKSNKYTEDIPVIMATGAMTTVESLKTALDSGAIDYIQKPINKIELVARVASALKLSDSYKQVKQLNDTKDKFFSIIAHDLKSPFNSLLGFANILTDSYDDYKEEDRKSIIQEISVGVKSTYRLLENLLIWSRSQRGILDINIVELNLRLIIDETIDLLQSQANKKYIVVLNDVSDDVFFKADRQMMNAILRNIMSNAIKFSNKGSEINCTVRDFENQKVVFSITDSGIGIPPDRKNQIFSLTDSISTRGTDGERGTGLGLIICKEFIEKQNGSIWFESNEGEGTTFFIELPN